MKAILDFKRIILMGLMLAVVSVGAFANNADEEKDQKTTNSIVEESTNSSVVERSSQVVTIMDGAEDYIPVPIEEGYVFSPRDTYVAGDDPGCISWSDANARSLVVRIIANYKGRAILRLVFVSIDEGPTKIIDIYVEVV